MLYVGSLVSTAIFGRLLFQENFTLKHIASLVLVFAGLSLFVYPFSFEAISYGIIAGILSGMLEGASHTMRKLMKNVRREVVVFWQSLSGVMLASLLLSVSSEVFVREFHLSSLVVAFVFGVLLVSIGYLLVYGYSHIDVNLGTTILATELFFALIINALILKEYPTSFELVGGLLIFSGTLLTSINLNGNKRKK